MLSEFPVIDFGKCGLEVENDEDLNHQELEKAGQELYKAFCKYGFAYISNGGIPSEKTEELNRITEKFFSLPVEEKMKYMLDDRIWGGYDPLGETTSNPKRGTDYFEAFRVSGRHLEDESMLLPDVEQFREKHIELMTLSRKLLLRILKSLGIGMKLKDPDKFCKTHSKLNMDGNTSAMKTLYYFPILDDSTLRVEQIRAGEHADVGSVTLLFQDENGGLQAQNPEGKYVDVTPIPGTIVLNVADVLQYWSGGRLKSTMHRVVPPSDPEKRKRVRRSIAYFGVPDNDVVIEKLEFEDGVENEKKESNVKVIKVSEFLARYAASYFPST